MPGHFVVLAAADDQAERHRLWTFGLFIGVEIDSSLGSARAVCEALMERGILSKETHETVVRLAPPLTISKAEIDWAMDQIRAVVGEMDKVRLAS